MAAATGQELTATRLELFKELGAATAEGAARAVAKHLKGGLTISEINSSLLRIETLTEATGDPENAAVAVYTRVEGHSPGHAVFLFPYWKAHSLAAAMRGPASDADAQVLPHRSTALRELGELLITSSLRALAEETGLDLRPATAMMSIDMACAIVSSVIALAGETARHSLIVGTHFDGAPGAVDGLFLYIFDSGSLEIMEEARIKLKCGSLSRPMESASYVIADAA